MWYIYVLWSEKLKKRYVGSTEDLDRRLKEHNRGKARYSRQGVPWVLIYKEECSGKKEAIHREHFLKSGIGRKWLDENFPEYTRRRRGRLVV